MNKQQHNRAPRPPSVLVNNLFVGMPAQQVRAIVRSSKIGLSAEAGLGTSRDKAACAESLVCLNVRTREIVKFVCSFIPVTPMTPQGPGGQPPGGKVFNVFQDGTEGFHSRPLEYDDKGNLKASAYSYAAYLDYAKMPAIIQDIEFRIFRVFRYDTNFARVGRFQILSFDEKILHERHGKPTEMVEKSKGNMVVEYDSMEQPLINIGRNNVGWYVKQKLLPELSRFTDFEILDGIGLKAKINALPPEIQEELLHANEEAFTGAPVEEKVPVNPAAVTAPRDEPEFERELEFEEEPSTEPMGKTVSSGNPEAFAEAGTEEEEANAFVPANPLPAASETVVEPLVATVTVTQTVTVVETGKVKAEETKEVKAEEAQAPEAQAPEVTEEEDDEDEINLAFPTPAAG